MFNWPLYARKSAATLLVFVPTVIVAVFVSAPTRTPTFFNCATLTASVSWLPAATLMIWRFCVSLPTETAPICAPASHWSNALTLALYARLRTTVPSTYLLFQPIFSLEAVVRLNKEPEPSATPPCTPETCAVAPIAVASYAFVPETVAPKPIAWERIFSVPDTLAPEPIAILSRDATEEPCPATKPSDASAWEPEPNTTE